MGKIVYIAEKPAVGKAIAGLLNPISKTQFSIACQNDIVVTWLSGHVLELIDAKDYDERYAKWSLDTLPIIPDKFKLRPTTDKKINGKKNDNSYKRDQVKALSVLLNIADEVVLASDPDAEGELLAREVVEYLGFKGKLSRILPTSLEPNELKKIIDSKFDAKETELLGMAGLSRSHIDWIVGINASRALTTYNQSKIDRPLNTGRVQAAITKVLHNRHVARENFVERNTYSIFANVDIDGKNVKLSYKPTKEENEILNPKAEFYDEGKAKALCEKISNDINGKSGKVIVCKKTKKSKKPPLGYKLTDMQIEMSKSIGLSASDTTAAIQKMYEAKQLTYPRTDNGYMPDEAHAYAPEIIPNIAPFLTEDISSVDFTIKTATWNTAKIENHHALMPTKVKVDINSLPRDHQVIYTTIAKRYVAQFLPDYTYFKTEIEIDICGRIFKSTGNSVIDLGWKIFENKAVKSNGDDDDDNNQSLPIVDVGTDISDALVALKQGKTTKPSLYTEATLIAALVDGYKLIEDKELSAVMKERKQGIGRQSTLATILSIMKHTGIFSDKTKKIELTDKGIMMAEISPDLLLDLGLTAKLEMSFKKIERAEITYEDLMDEYRKNVHDMIDDVKNGKCELKKALIKVVPCLICSEGSLVKRYRKSDKKPFWICGSCNEIFADKENKPTIRAKKETCPYCNTETAFMFDFKNVKNKSGWMCGSCKAVFVDNKGAMDKKLHKCKSCGSHLNRIYSKKAKKFIWVCSSKDNCKEIYSDNEQNLSPILEKPKLIIADEKCPKCGGDLIFRSRKNGDGGFYGCSNWNKKGVECKEIYDDLNGKPNLNKVVHSCPLCKSGKLVRRNGKKGYWWGCSNWNKKGIECKAVYKDINGEPMLVTI
ncbi:DNA topoisomerase [Photobacterium kishitanii]|uniref:DNA topoisomerase n=1 Tax=Photobacterium kishitanii TaxID=318456 RepID=A0A2T3KN17_9GAMM|nr:DNA topoisomerase [Photobacterium kishitanii]PSV01191.1 hypothetical protein C9J27_03975 [Photobacterium kishitanii]